MKLIYSLFLTLISLAAFATNHNVSVTMLFTPSTLSINQGDTVTWTQASGFHNVNGTQSTFPGNPASFGSGSVAGGVWTYSYVFSSPGVYNYHCDPHSSFMTGSITVSSTSSQNLPCYVSSNSLERWYPFDGNANNVSSSSGNGVTTNATLTTDRYGNVNSAYSFNNTGYIQTPTLGQISSTSLTMSCWVNPDSSQIGSYNGVVSNQQSNSSGFLFQISGNKPWVTVSNGSGYYDLVHTNAFGSGWTHIVQVIKPGLMELYIDGIKTDSTTLAAYGLHAASALYIGARRFGTSTYEYYSGSIDDVGIWSRALTAQEIQYLYLSSCCNDTIQQQPQSNTFYTVPGDAYFSVTHSDTAATFQWQQNNGTGWSNLSDLGIYSGTTTDSVILTGVTPSLNNYGFRCIVNACNMDTTDVATLTVVVTCQGQAAPDTTVTASGPLDFCSNGSVTLTAAAGQNYLWNNGDTSQSITTGLSGSYYAIITSPGGCIDTTATYIITVFADPDISVTTSTSLNLCSGESITLNAAPGQNYLWNTGATAQSITTGLAGSYFAVITTSDGCVDTTASYLVTVNPVPNPTILAPQLGLCSGQTVTLSTQTTYSSYVWGGDSTGTQDTLVVTPGTYWISITNSSGCIGTDTITITELAPYTTQPEVCIVTNDPVTGFNQIIWERSSKKGVEYYNVYRDGVIGYTKVGTKGVNQPSQLMDNAANPGLQPYKYYLTITDSCGNEHGSNISEHSTIHLQSSIGTSGEVNLLWTSYLGRTPLYYRISRKASSASIYTVIDSVNLSNNTYTDFNPPTGYTKYQIAAVMGSGCNSSSKTGVTSSLSNSTAQNTISIKEDEISSIAISPNPNTGYFSITVDQQQVGSVYRIIDNLGRLIDKGIITEQNQAFDLSDKPKGVYRIQVSNENIAKTLSVVIQ